MSSSISISISRYRLYTEALIIGMGPVSILVHSWQLKALQHLTRERLGQIGIDCYASWNEV